jgi:mono/diheme cytochrome c family protein
MRLRTLAAGVYSAFFLVSPSAAEAPLERGRYLVESIAACGNCHTPKGPQGAPLADRNLAGGFVIEEPDFTAVAPNVTPDRDTGIGSWTDEQIARAIREGIRPDGSLIGPPMPFELYRGISDSDLQAIVVYLRNIPAASNRVTQKSQYRIPLPKSWGPPLRTVAEVPRSDMVKYGAYLAGPIGHCIECHTPMVQGRRDWSRTGQGGYEFAGPWGVSVARNITPHRGEGLGAWSDAEIKRAITQGISRDDTRLAPPMAFAYYAKMTEQDLDAIVAYLRSLKPLPSAR